MSNITITKRKGKYVSVNSVDSLEEGESRKESAQSYFERASSIIRTT